MHQQTQGKIECWHQAMKNRVLLENYFLPGELEQAIGRFVDYYNQHRYHESLQNLTPANVFAGCGARHSRKADQDQAPNAATTTSAISEKNRLNDNHLMDRSS